jgi:hypothetical protein
MKHGLIRPHTSSSCGVVAISSRQGGRRLSATISRQSSKHSNIQLLHLPGQRTCSVVEDNLCATGSRLSCALGACFSSANFKRAPLRLAQGTIDSIRDTISRLRTCGLLFDCLNIAFKPHLISANVFSSPILSAIDHRRRDF